MTRNTLAILGAAGLLASCAALQAPAPERRPASPRTWDVPPSVLALPVRVPQSMVKTWTESVVPPVITGEGTGQRTLTAWFLKHDWHYWWSYSLKRTPLSLGFEGSKVRVASSLTGTLEARWDTLPGDISSEVEADAGVEADLGLESDWTLRASTRSFLDVRRADVPIGIAWDGNFFGETISIAGPVQEALQPSLAKLDQELDQRLARIEVKPAVEALWRDLQEPRALAGAERLWFTLGPQSIALGPVTASADQLSLALVLTARPGLVLGARPEGPRRPLPPAEPAPEETSRIVLNLPVTIDWAEASRMARDRLPPDGLWPVGNGAKVKIRNLEASTDGGRILVRLEGRVSPPWPGPEVDAVFWIGALPRWDPVTRTLGVTNVSLDVRTRDFLTQSASWLMAGTWVRDLERVLVWDLGPDLDNLRDQASRALASQTVAPHLVLSMVLDRLEVQDLTLADRGPEVLARIEGTGTLTWVP